eukprot:4668197-Prymnesium_polylepis.1
MGDKEGAVARESTAVTDGSGQRADPLDFDECPGERGARCRQVEDVRSRMNWSAEDVLAGLTTTTEPSAAHGPSRQYS